MNEIPSEPSTSGASLTFGRNVAIGIVMALLAVLVMGLVSRHQVNVAQENFNSVNQAQGVIASLRGVLEDVRQAEAAQRGYLLTGSSAEVRAYRAALRSLASQRAELSRRIEGSDARQRGSFLLLDSLIGARALRMEHVLGVYRTQGFARARALVQQGEGQIQTEGIAAQVAAMQAEEYDLLASRMGSTTSNQNIAATVILLSTVITMLLLVGAGLLINRDFKRRLTAEAELRSALIRADAANAAKTQFLATVSHEIRTPLNAVMGMTELLLDTRMASEQVEFARTIHTNAEALSILISDLLDSSKIEAGQVDLEAIPFDPGEIIDGVAEILAIRAELKGIELVVCLGPEFPSKVLGDPNRFRQVLMNLVGNAIKFTPEGEVVVTGGVLTGEDGAPRLCVSVRDTGIGIAADDQKKIFERFVQAERSTVRRFGGTGLGLPIASSLVKLMGGSLTLESEPSVGSEFSFELPLPVLAGPIGRDDGDRKSLNGARVLVLDQSSTRRDSICVTLRDAGAVVEAPASLMEAVSLLESGSKYSVAVVDEALGGESGMELEPVMSAFRSAEGGIPVILLVSLHSALPMRSHAAMIAQRLYKPVRSSRLLRAVRHTLGLDESSETAASATVGVGHAPTGVLPPRILLVEDQRDNWVLATRLLTGAGYEVDLADNGLLAFERAKEFTYDMILMDIEMPLMDGIQATGAIRAEERASRKPHVPIVALTAHAMEEFRERGMASGMDDYLTKPVKKQQLLSVCEKWIEKRPLIVIADDSAENHMLLANYFKDLPYRLRTVSNGLEAVEAVRRQRVSLVLLDMDMPVMDGYEAARTIRSLPKGGTIPIVAITGYEGSEERERCLAAGCSAYIAKPLRRAELVKTVAALLGNGAVTDALPTAERRAMAAFTQAPAATRGASSSLQQVREKRGRIHLLRKYAAQRQFERLESEAREIETLGRMSGVKALALAAAEVREGIARSDAEAVAMWIDRVAEALKSAERLVVVRESGLLDSSPDETFDRLTRLAASVLHVPTAVISIVDEDRQFFKSCVGVSEPYATARGTPMSHSFCQHVAARVEPLVVSDAREHDLVRDNPAIRDMDVIAYAGTPLMSEDGIALGSFCAIDTKPRRWSEEDMSMLRDLAALAMAHWEHTREEQEQLL